MRRACRRRPLSEALDKAEEYGITVVSMQRDGKRCSDRRGEVHAQIATRVPLTGQHFRDHGDIGVLCDDLAGLGGFPALLGA